MSRIRRPTLLVWLACTYVGCSLLAPSHDELSGGRTDAGMAAGTATAGGGEGGVSASGGLAAGAEGGSAGDANTNGGASGNGGAGGAPNVLTCDSLGASGEWQEITPPDVDLGCNPNPPDSTNCQNLGTKAFALDPLNPGTLYLGAHKQGLWKSTDCGGSWAIISTGRNGILITASDLWQVEIDPVDSQLLYAANFDAEYKSTDGGVDWDKIWPTDPAIPEAPPWVDALAIDRDDHEHLLMNFRNMCSDAFAPSCIAESSDGGLSWGLIKTPGTDRGRGWFIDSATWLYAQGGGLWRSSDSGVSFQQLAASGVDSIGGRMYRAENGAYYLGAQGGVLTSADGASWNFIQNSGQFDVAGVVGNADTLYTSSSGLCNEGVPGEPFRSAPADVGTPWTTYSSPSMTQGAYALGYDLEHHLLYSSSCRQGFWRVVTQ